MKKSDRKSIISAVKRVIIKIGSSVLTDKKGNLSESVFNVLAEEISGIKARMEKAA